MISIDDSSFQKIKTNRNLIIQKKDLGLKSINRYSTENQIEKDLVRSFSQFLSDRQAQNLSDGTILFYQTKFKAFIKFIQPFRIDQVTDLTPQLIRD